ncbi:GTP-binding protein [Xylaria palmicola]|nr:GTP-binding protein [Xylaria palmicola]
MEQEFHTAPVPGLHEHIDEKLSGIHEAPNVAPELPSEVPSEVPPSEPFPDVHPDAHAGIHPDAHPDVHPDAIPDAIPGQNEVPHELQFLDHGLTHRQAPDELDSNGRYETVPIGTHPQSITRPPSGLSGAGSDQHTLYSSTGGDQHTLYGDRGSNSADQASTRNQVVIKVGMVGDAQIGKTSLMVKYVEGSWDEDYIQTLGVNFMEKTISIRNTEITFSIWDLGGQREFVNMLPLVCNDAVAILFMFDLTRKSTLNSIKEWYRQGRGFNKTAIPVLVGTKYDHFVNFSREEQEEISNQARRFAKAMRASLIFSSTSHSINVQKVFQQALATCQQLMFILTPWQIFKIVLSKAFDLKCTIPEIENVGEPLLLYQSC